MPREPHPPRTLRLVVLLLSFLESFGTILLERAIYFFAQERLGYSETENLALALCFGATYTLDTSKSPWVIHMTSTAPTEGQKADGLIEKKGNEIRLIYALPGRGASAPTEFKTQKGQQMFVLKPVNAVREK